MREDPRTISAAAVAVDRARSTIQGWIRAGRLKKKAGGKVSLRDVNRCMTRQRTGRPGGGYRSRYESQAEALAAPFLRAEGLHRLRTMLHYCAFELGYRGKMEPFKDILADALTHVVKGMEYREKQRNTGL